MERYHNIVVLTGAGLSAESGLGTFRGPGGLCEMPREMERIDEALGACDLFISIGTSGTVYPAAGFVMEARAAGAHAVELNLEPSDGADLFLERIEGQATEIVPAYVDRLLRTKP